MIQLPQQLFRQFTTFITHRGVPPREQQYYVKWLRFYLDFCHKYNFRQKENKSLSAFMGKLREKKQSEKQRKQARHAVTLYFELVSQSTKKGANNPTQGQKSKVNQPSRTREEIFCQENKGVEDVNGFLTWLTVEKDVAAFVFQNVFLFAFIILILTCKFSLFMTVKEKRQSSTYTGRIDGCVEGAA